jgi:cell division inhibitor SulA
VPSTPVQTQRIRSALPINVRKPKSYWLMALVKIASLSREAMQVAGTARLKLAQMRKFYWRMALARLASHIPGRIQILEIA